MLTDLSTLQLALIFLIFVWSGFVRTGLGFGGALLSMPFILLIDNRPLFYLPIFCVHLLIFSPITVYFSHKKQRATRSDSNQATQSPIDWVELLRALKVMLIPKVIGVAGIIILPSQFVSFLIFGFVAFYALTYILNKPLKSHHPWLDNTFLILGAYISGSSLMGGPLILAVLINRIKKSQFRDTIFVLWFILVVIKMTAFVLAGIDLQWAQHLWLLPAAFIGHFIGVRFHEYLAQQNAVRFYQVLGYVLLISSILGILQGQL